MQQEINKPGGKPEEASNGVNVLDAIVEDKKHELSEAKNRVPLEVLREGIQANFVRRPFQKLFERPEGALIAEIKPRSPSVGTLIESDPLATADVYAQSVADAISVLTDREHFGGSLELLQEVRARVPQAILRKDFLIDEYQLYESRAAHADAVLLIVAILDDAQLHSMLELARKLTLDTLTEVHDERELERALAAKAALIGINNRNLKTLEIDLSTTDRLMTRVPKGQCVISESGIETAEDVKRVRAGGTSGILVGTSILQSGDPLAKIAELKTALEK